MNCSGRSIENGITEILGVSWKVIGDEVRRVRREGKDRDMGYIALHR